ncbi:MAG TPA: type II toxin-antitoxin system HicB family antitoxin [Verrucomicrobiae bacterium]|nr:type II toxin-antitoxin system HicB family antitoxin [Verrucomicrobiae bacterium]
MITRFHIERSVLPASIVSVSAFFEATRRDDHDHVPGVTERAEREPWLEYFTEGAARQSEDAPWRRCQSSRCDLLDSTPWGRLRMKYYTFEIVVERELEDEGYTAYSPTLPGCFSNGKTMDEARRNMRDAIQQHVEALAALGKPIPQTEKLVYVEELTVGVP